MDTKNRDGAEGKDVAWSEAAYPFEMPTYLLHLLVAIDRQRDLRLEERMRGHHQRLHAEAIPRGISTT